MKNFKITANGFIKIYHDGEQVGIYLYSPCCEKIWEDAGYTEIF